MPRMTRAAARTAIHEDEPEVDAAEVPLPQTPQRPRDQQPQRAPLGEITLNPQEEEPKIMLEVDLNKPAKNAKGKKGKAGRKPKKADDKENNGEEYHDVDEDKENTPEVVEDDNQSRPSSAAEEACADLLKDTKQALDQIKRDIRPTTPPSRAVRSARKQLSPKAHTPHFNPDVHRAPEVEQMFEEKEDSFVENIETRSPAKISADPFVEESPGVSDAMPILSPVGYPSPQRSPRIEDSIEAIDAAEEALEKLGQSIPNIEDEPVSPVSTRRPASPPKAKLEAPNMASKTSTKSVTKPKSTRKTVTEAPKAGTIRKSPVKPTTKTISPRPVTKPIAPRLATTKTNSEPKVANAKAPTSSKPTVTKRTTSSTPSIAASKPPTKAMTMPMRPKQRVSSINKAPFVPTKSTKAPTKSSFTLPGEAIAARLKEQREKREEEAASTTSQPSTHAPKAATIGRMSTRPSLANAKLGPGGTLRMAKAPRASILPEKRIASNASADSMAVNVGGSSNTAAKRSSILHRPNTSAPRASIITNASSTVTRAPAASRLSYVSKTMPAQRSKPVGVSGKEVFERERKGLDAQALARREKEDAAKKARAEAAERGRQASREWAEKMKARNAAAKKVQSVSKGEVVVQAKSVEAGA